MKKLFFILTVTIYSLACFSQSKDLIINSIPLPDGYEKIDTIEAKNHILRKFNGNKMVYESVRGYHYIYKIGDLLIVLNPQQGKVEEGHLSTIKRGFDAMSGNNKTYTSNIETINNNVVLTTNSTLNGVGYRSIFANNAGNTKLFSALIQYNISDSLKAIKIAEHIKNHLKFSN